MSMEVLSTNPSMQNLIDKINELVESVNGTLVTNSEEMAAIKKLVSFGSDVLAAKLNSKLWYFKTQELMVASGELVEGDSCFILGANTETGKGTFSYWYIYKTDDVKDIIDSYVALNNPNLVAVKLSNLESVEEIKGLISEHNKDNTAHNDIRTLISNLPAWAKETTPDATLTKSGKAADAKAVGDLIKSNGIAIVQTNNTLTITNGGEE